LPRLKDHLLGRLVEEDESDGTFTNLDRMSLKLVNNRIYRHKVLRVNYTTYDSRRCQDSLNPRTHGDIMVLSRDDSHPYWYARIIGIFHAMVLHTGQKSKSQEAKKMEFLFVRWFGLDTKEVGGWETKKLHQIGFADGDWKFGFVDPADVVRAVHLIPRFSEGRTKDLLGPSIARSDQEKDEDWVRYYVNMYVYLISACLDTELCHFRFVDRDMFMRFRGGGVGHAATRAATDTFKTDRDDLDIQSREARNEAFNLEQEEEMAEEELNENEMARGPNIDIDAIPDGAEDDIEEEEGELSEGELLDYSYEREIDSDDEEEGEEDDREEDDEEEVGDELTIEELEELGYAAF